LSEGYISGDSGLMTATTVASCPCIPGYVFNNAVLGRDAEINRTMA